jgi:prepilin-type N-terminal cleavage/methylation domain-containing protein
MNHATHSLFRSVRSSSRERASRRGERGITLIELMIAMVVGSILVGFVFDIHSRMTDAFRSQNNIGSLQQGIRAANELMARDIRQAGFMMPDGAFVASSFNPLTSPVVQVVGGNKLVSGLTIFNNPSTRNDNEMQPDRVHIFYADPNPVHQAVVVGDITPVSVGVNISSVFQFNDLLLFVRQDPVPRPHPLGGTMPNLTGYFACVVQVTGTSGVDSPNGHDQIFFDPGTAFNTATNDHCFVPGKEAIVDPVPLGPNAPKTQVFRLIARAYQINTDPGRPAQGALEIHPSGGLDGPWSTMGIGFVDLQVTQRRVEEVSDLADLDGDGNDRVDWYSSGGPFPANSHLTQVGVSLVARSVREVEGVVSATIPVLQDPGFPRAHNPLGDSGGPKLRTNPEYRGDHVFRQSSMVVDMRNIGVSF